MDDRNKFENLIRSFRAHMGETWSQKVAAEAIDVSPRTYWKWEKGEVLPDARQLKRIATAFKLSHEDADILYRAAAQVPPKIQNLPFPQNPLFTGRATYLEQLGKLLQETRTVEIAQPVSISGLGGIGKTQLALEYAHRYHPNTYRAVLWVNAADSTTLQASYDSIAHLLDLPEKDERGPDQRLRAVKQWLETHTNWLLIMDNADDLLLARSYFPIKHRGHILLTTRSQAAGNIAKRIEIEVMEPDDGLLFLLRRSGIMHGEATLDVVSSDIRGTALLLVKLLGGHPLALDQAGAYIEETGISFIDYMSLYHKQRRFLLDRPRSLLDEHPETLATTFELCFTRARERHPMAADILYFCAFLQPDSIPEELFGYDESFMLDMTAFNEGIAALRRYSLIKIHSQDKTFLWEKELSIHRLVQAVLIDTMPHDLQKQWRGRVVQILDAALPEREARIGPYPKRLLPQVLACATWTENMVVTTRELADLLQKIAMRRADEAYRQYGEHEKSLRADGERFSLQAVSFCASLTKSGDYELISEILETLRYIADAWSNRGDYKRAERLYQDALSACEQYLGTNGLDTAITVNCLATVYLEQEDYATAETLRLRGLRIITHVLGQDHPYAANTLQEFADSYKRRGQYDKAELLYHQAMAIFERVLGSEDIHVILVVKSLAGLYTAQGRYEEAEPLYLGYVAYNEKWRRPGDSITANSIMDLATFYMDQRKYEKAEPLLERLVDIQELQLDRGDFFLESWFHDMVLALKHRGKYERVDALYRRVLTIQEQELGTDHPTGRDTRTLYAEFLRSIGRDAEATALETNDDPSE